MKLTVLGCWAPYPKAGGACSGYLLETEDAKVLIDCGNGVFSNLQHYVDFWLLDAVIITHLHPDHSGDIHSLRHAVAGAIRLGRRRDKLPVYLPFAPQKDYQLVFKCSDTLNLINLQELAEIKFRETIVLPFPVKHAIPTCGLSITSGNRKLVYTSDTGWFDQLISFADGASLLIVEASLQEKDRENTRVGHLTAHEAGVLGRKGGVEQLLLTHFWPEYDLSVTCREAEEGFQKKVLIAREGLTIG